MTPMGAPDSPRPGVNLVGFLEVESGLGEIARRLAAALDSSGVPISAIPYRGTHARQSHPHGLTLGDEAPYDTNLVCLSADDLVQVRCRGGERLLREEVLDRGLVLGDGRLSRRLIEAAARFLDELWVASDYVRESVPRRSRSPSTSCRCRSSRHAVDCDALRARPTGRVHVPLRVRLLER